MERPTHASAIAHLLDKEVIVETTGYYIIAGTLRAADELWLTLEDADMHDHRESNSTREVYIMDIAKYGIRKNRDRVLVRLDEVVTLSLKDDVTVY